VFALNTSLVLIALISAENSSLVAKAVGFALALLLTGATLYKMGRAAPRR
jgi:hypothetical protein